MQTEHGWFQAHAYRYEDGMSTFIVETPEETWQAAGIEQMSQEEGIAYCEKLFAPWLDGNPLVSNASHLRGSAIWIRFPRVICNTWVHWNTLDTARGERRVPVVLMGDAAHTAHFSIGSGTKLALEDSIELARCLSGAEGSVEHGLKHYEEVRSVEVLKIQNAARNSTEWFENVKRYAGLEPEQFAYSLLTRSQRISHENLRLRDPAWLEGFERWIAERAGAPAPAGQRPAMPMLTPYQARGVRLKNRIMVSPMAMYSCQDGVPGDFHLVHLGGRAMGGAGLVMVEMTCVSPDARITPGCPGLWNDEQARAFTRIVDFVHGNSDARIGVQIGHAGRKGSTQLGWQKIDHPLAEGNWPLLSASALPYIEGVSQTPRAMTRADMDQVRDNFVAATRRAVAAGFDWLELHCAHGYLLSSFISPLTNQRDDEYGGSLENRLRYPLEVFHAVRAAWPRTSPCRCGSRRTTGSRAASPRRRGRDRAPLQGRRRRHDRLLVRPGQQGRSPSTAACSRRPSPTACATKPAFPPSPWARSSRPTTPTPSSRPAAPTCARWPVRTWPTRPGRCAKPPAWAIVT